MNKDYISSWTGAFSLLLLVSLPVDFFVVAFFSLNAKICASKGGKRQIGAMKLFLYVLRGEGELC